MAKMSIKQQRFADEYIISGNASEAAIKAGYSKKYAGQNADKLLKNTNVSAYIEKRMEELQSEKVADQQEVMEYLTLVMRGDVKDEMLLVTGDETGSQVEKHERRSETPARTKAAELIGKRYAMWTEKQQVEDVTPRFVEDVPEDDN